MNTFKKKSTYAKKSSSVRPGYGASRSRSAFGGRDSDQSVERFAAECNSCHARCEVPFKPNGKKPVYCRDCFKGKEETPSYSRPSSGSREDREFADLKKQFNVLNTKLEKLIAVIEEQTRVLAEDK